MRTSAAAKAVDVLCSDRLAHLVELVAWSPEPGIFEARAVDGAVRFARANPGDGAVRSERANPGDGAVRSERANPGEGASFYELDVEGRNPLGDQDPARFSPLTSELDNLFPDRSTNSYPYAYEHVAQVFDHPCAPDLVAIHTAAHRYDTNIGHHGSLSVVQARAPFIASGPGIARRGLVDGHCRLVDVAPTVLRLLGCRPVESRPGPDGAEVGVYLSRQDGAVVEEVLDASGTLPRRVVVFLLDGCNANVLYDAAERGQVPTIAELISEGTAFRQGAVSTLPTVTLANHTTLLTGCHPAHHGVLHNAWWDRRRQAQVVTESIATWHVAMQWLNPGVETIHEALKRNRPGAVSYSVNEPADRGADWSTFEVFRQGRQMEIMPDLAGPFPLASREVADFSPHTRFGVVAETMALEHATGLFAGEVDGKRWPLPDLCWVNMPLTDAVFHDTGPHSELARMALAETDSRIAAILEAIDRAGVRDETAVLVVADHGMEESDPDLTEDWSPLLSEAGISFRDEAYGFIYVDP
jgi:phosphonoacetate hydrolase